MHDLKQQLRDKLGNSSRSWIDDGLPSREGIEVTADRLDEWKRVNGVETIWPRRPAMITATLDDGMGHGLTIIRRYAECMGLSVNHLGLLKKDVEILAACLQDPPDFLGMTVLQLDSDEALARVGHGLPESTQLIAGGPVFRFDEDMASRCNVSYVAKNVAYFIDYLLKWKPGHGART